jgi:hypothetical protein
MAGSLTQPGCGRWSLFREVSDAEVCGSADRRDIAGGFIAAVVVLVALGQYSYQRYGGIGPAYGTLSSGFWWPFTLTAAAPAVMTGQVLWNRTSTADIPATMTANTIATQGFAP